MSYDRTQLTLSNLLMRHLSHGLNDEECAHLQDWLAEDSEARQYYVEFMALNAHLRKQRVASVATESLNIDLGEVDLDRVEAEPCQDTDQDSEVQTSENIDEIRRIAEQRLQAFLADEEQMRRQQAMVRRAQDTPMLLENLHQLITRIYTGATWLLKNTVRLSAVAAVLLIGLAVTQYMLRHRVVATLGETVHARWDRSPADPNLHPGPLFLKEGFAKLTFKQGAEVIFQAPCEFELTSKNSMVLQRGTITARIPAQAHGFAIQTPQSTVTDFGTEFGVQVQGSAASEVQVFDGRVQVQTASRGHQPSPNQDVTKGKAALITKSGALTIESLEGRPRHFVRDVPEMTAFGIPNRRMDLADIVGGGSGFGTGRRYAGIDPVSGRTVSTYRSEKRIGGQGYVATPSLPLIDGVFVPPAQGGLMPVSTGAHYYDFPAGGAGAGSWFVEMAHAGEAKHRDLPHETLVLAGQYYGTVTHPALLMHANQGITFDLDAIRASLAGSRIKRFTSVCGISNHVQSTKTPAAVFCVLVDGRVRFHRNIQLPDVLAVDIDINLRENEQFLTLVCMAGAQNHGDWTFFGVPALELDSGE
jgi:hypothetical protein